VFVIAMVVIPTMALWFAQRLRHKKA